MEYLVRTVTSKYDNAAKINIHHQTGNTVEPFFWVPNGLICPSAPKAIEGFR
jgi:hypothetical protein